MTAATETVLATRDDTAVVQQMTDRLLGLVAKADNGNKGALAELGATLRESPALLKSLSGLAHAAEAALLDAIGLDKQPGARVVIEQQLAVMRRELLEPNATPLERLLVQRLAADWLWCQYHDLRCAAKCKGSMTFKEGSTGNVAGSGPSASFSAPRKRWRPCGDCWDRRSKSISLTSS